ncbi:MAG: hypothetical protein LKG25_04495 [Prevotella sp.]|jgi:hypothetical protein|nr:hypothetical protein [Prevotella sp.]MCI1281834.1 hypothetical protein [Prevotella sp.]
MMIKLRYILPILALMTVVQAQAQNTEKNAEGKYQYDDAGLLWMHTDNAAALESERTQNRGYATFDFQHSSGNYSRVQEGNMNNRLQFFTERYQSISKHLYGYGKFVFSMDHTKDRAWSDVRRTYNSNPYFSGSSILANYDQQDINLTAAVSTISFNGLRLGMKLDYNLGDLSRLRDPRSRSEMLEYKLTPSVSYTIGAHTFGLSGHYNRYKEKIPDIKTVQTDPTLKYYLMSGMENAIGAIGAYNGFDREWVNHNFGGELSYGYKAQGYRSVTALSLQRGEEHVYETYKYEPGQYITYLYGAKTMHRIISNAFIHQLDVAFNYQQGYADEYREQLNITTDSTTGFNSYHYINQMTYRKRYQVRTYDLSWHYRLNWTIGQAVTAYAGIYGNLQKQSNKYLLNTSSFDYRSMDWTLEGGKALFSSQLWIKAQAGYHESLKNNLFLANSETDYAKNVLLADANYYDANYWRGHLELLYQFPLSIKKARSIWYVKAYGDYLHTNNSLHASTIGVSIGLFN